jgi:formylglycine-generating enzyme required for sulfatase activity
MLLGFVKIEEGSFLMGEGDEQHEITLPTYYIARYPVTVAQFRAYVTDIKPERTSAIGGLDNHPMVEVNWNEALGYCKWLKKELLGKDAPESLVTLLKREGWTITLPSEAEWEKAARGALQMESGLTIGGVNGLSTAFQGRNPKPDRMYPWGDELDPERANYLDTGIGTTSAVGCFLGGVSPYGVEDLSGNTWEWTRSLWGRNEQKPEFKYPYNPKDGREDLQADQSVRRVLRGGAFDNQGRDIRCACRISNYPDERGGVMGFRLVLTCFESDPLAS